MYLKQDDIYILIAKINEDKELWVAKYAFQN